VARHPFSAVNLISDPIHGYVELTKRLTPDEAADAGLPAEDVAEDDLLDTAWLQRLRRISQLQSARWVFPTAEHSRFTHGLGVMHEAGLWARSLYPTLRSALATIAPGESVPSEGLVVETLRVAGLLHDVGHGPFAHFFDDQVLARFPAPPDERRARQGKVLSHEDLSQLIVERELGPLIGSLRRAPGAVPERDAFGQREAIEPRWVAFLISKPALDDASMPAWVRLLQPLLSGVFTVDNLDYVRRDAFFTGVKVGIDVERLRRYTYVSDRGLTLYEPGLPALEGFLGARLLLHQAVYFHRAVRAIDLDLGEVFRPSVEALFGADSPAERLDGYADLDEYALLHQAARWARGESVAGAGEVPTPGDGFVDEAVADGWRGILLRRPRWRAEAELRLTYEDGAVAASELAALGSAEPGRVAIDLATVDARPVGSGDRGDPLAIEARDGTFIPLATALARIPAFAVIGRRYRRIG
jgi:HD superfamily phosphohydrolase